MQTSVDLSLSFIPFLFQLYVKGNGSDKIEKHIGYAWRLNGMYSQPCKSLNTADRDLCSNRTVTGSIEDVFNYIAQVDPATAAAINNTVNEELAKSNSPAAPSHDLAGLSPQSQPTVHMCNLPQWDTCSAHRAQQGVYYLGTVPGQPGMGPGPGNCGRVSCSYGAAIYWCNDVSTQSPAR